MKRRKLTLHRLPEYLETFFKKYGREWTRGWHFVYDESVDQSLPGTVYIYCSAPRYYTFRLDIGWLPRVPASGFWCWRGFYPEFNEASSNVLINSGSKVLGLYVPRHSLYLTDIMTSSDDMDVAYWVLRRIFQVLDIPLVQQKVDKITMGADPEFLLGEGDNIIEASQVFSDRWGSVGCDGSGDQLELRPEPGTPREVIRNLKGLVKFVSEKGYDVRIGDMFPLGGHVHVGLGRRVRPSKELLAVYDDFLGRPTRFLCNRYGYGYLSDWESKPWGFEYRTPSAVIFADPTIARISLKIIQNITKLAIQKKEISYEQPPTVEDYCRVGKLSKMEVEQFLNFTRNAQKYKTSILGFWKVVPARKTWSLELRFEDEWDPEVMNLMKRVVKRWRLRKPLRVTLFGLHEKRGKVNTIRVPGYRRTKNVVNNPNYVGVARIIRITGKDISVFTRALRRYIRKEFNA